MNCMKISEVTANSRNRRIFRQIARDATGETYDAADDDLVFLSAGNHGNVIGVASYTKADVAATEINEKGHAHQLNYMFVRPRHQRNGYGTALLAAVEAAMSRKCPYRSIHIQSSYKAVRFFEGHGYEKVGEPVKCVCAGSRLFDRLQHMQKIVPPRYTTQSIVKEIVPHNLMSG